MTRKQGKNSDERGILKESNPHTLIREFGIFNKRNIINTVVGDIRSAIVKLVNSNNFTLMRKL